MAWINYYSNSDPGRAGIASQTRYTTLVIALTLLSYENPSSIWELNYGPQICGANKLVTCAPRTTLRSSETNNASRKCISCFLHQLQQPSFLTVPDVSDTSQVRVSVTILAPNWISNRANTIARLPVTESLSVGETSSTPWKRRGKYCAAFDCNNSAYNVNGTRTSYHFFEFPKDAQRRNRWCSLIKRRHGQDDFVVSTATVLCHEHFRAEDISKKLSGCWNLKTGLWYCRAFVVLLLCLWARSKVWLVFRQWQSRFLHTYCNTIPSHFPYE